MENTKKFEIIFPGTFCLSHVYICPILITFAGYRQIFVEISSNYMKILSNESRTGAYGQADRRTGGQADRRIYI